MEEGRYVLIDLHDRAFTVDCIHAQHQLIHSSLSTAATLCVGIYHSQVEQEHAAANRNVDG